MFNQINKSSYLHENNPIHFSASKFHKLTVYQLRYSLAIPFIG